MLARIGISVREFARREEVSHTAVQKAIREGRLSAHEDGSVDPDFVGSAWCERNARRAAETSSPARPAKKAKRRKQDTEELDSTDPRQLAIGLGALFDTKIEADKFAAAYRGALNKIDFDLKSGKVVEVEVVADQVAEVLRGVRSRLLAIPAAVAPTVAALRSPAEVRAALELEINSALEELATDGESDSSDTQP